MKIRILVAAAALASAAGCAGGDGGTTVGSAVGSAAPVTASASPVGGATTSPASPPQASSEPSTTTAPTGAAPTIAAPTGSPSSGGGTASSGTRCHTSQLAASFRAGEPGAGQRYATLQLTNRSQRTCTIFGYGGLQPLDAAKKQLPVTLTRDTGRPARLVRLAPGASVGRTIHWSVVPGGTQPCVTPAYAAIIPPDETDPLVVAWSPGPICGGRMDGWPYGVTL